LVVDTTPLLQAMLEAALQTQHRRCEELTQAYQRLTAEKSRAQGVDEDLVRRLGETLRLLRLAKQAEEELRRVRAVANRAPTAC